ncbi:MAG: helix-turn-helix domain-containing protein [Caulobacteraceae bacterium]
MSLDFAELDGEAIDVIIGSNIRSARKKLGFSQAALGLELHCSQQQVQKYETDKNRISISQLVHVADALGVTAEQLLPDSTAPLDGDALSVPGAIGLLDLFYVLKSKKHKTAVLNLIRALRPN